MSEPQAADAVLLTPPGRGAVATIVVQGPGATERVARHFRAANGRPLAEQSLDRIVFGRWTPSGEELVVCRRADDRLEIHCHGGTAAAGTVLEPLVAEGCRPLDWQAWLRREEPDPIAAEARLALARAGTTRTAAILLDQYAGALGGEIVAVRSLILSGALGSAADRLQRLLRFASLGLHLVEPWRVVLAGRPNVGKSSLINALVGYRRAIVFDQPGTTRDVVTAATVVDGWPVELSDTAGLTAGPRAGPRASDDSTEAAGVERARVGLAEADLVVLVFDASASPSVEDRGLAQGWPDAIWVQNKCDLVGDAAAIDRGLPVSALTGEGLERLMDRLRERLVPEAPAVGAAVPFCSSQVAAIRRAVAALEAGEAERAAAELNDLLAR